MACKRVRKWWGHESGAGQGSERVRNRALGESIFTICSSLSESSLVSSERGSTCRGLTKGSVRVLMFPWLPALRHGRGVVWSMSCMRSDIRLTRFS